MSLSFGRLSGRVTWLCAVRPPAEFKEEGDGFASGLVVLNR